MGQSSRDKWDWDSALSKSLPRQFSPADPPPDQRISFRWSAPVLEGREFLMLLAACPLFLHLPALSDLSGRPDTPCKGFQLRSLPASYAGLLNCALCPHPSSDALASCCSSDTLMF